MFSEGTGGGGGVSVTPFWRQYHPGRSDRLAISECRAHSFDMKTRDDLQDKLAEHGGATERGHEAWKRAKIERGLAQAQDRATLIPMNKILRDFGLER